MGLRRALEARPATVDHLDGYVEAIVAEGAPVSAAQSGAGLLLGSDAPQVFNVPGFSIHEELGALVQAGLKPYDALATGTRNVAAFFGAARA